MVRMVGIEPTPDVSKTAFLSVELHAQNGRDGRIRTYNALRAAGLQSAVLPVVRHLDVFLAAVAAILFYGYISLSINPTSLGSTTLSLFDLLLLCGINEFSLSRQLLRSRELPL
jgi:hypothetical protein